MNGHDCIYHNYVGVHGNILTLFTGRNGGRCLEYWLDFDCIVELNLLHVRVPEDTTFRKLFERQCCQSSAAKQGTLLNLGGLERVCIGTGDVEEGVRRRHQFELVFTVRINPV